MLKAVKWNDQAKNAIEKAKFKWVPKELKSDHLLFDNNVATLSKLAQSADDDCAEFRLKTRPIASLLPSDFVPIRNAGVSHETKAALQPGTVQVGIVSVAPIGQNRALSFHFPIQRALGSAVAAVLSAVVPPMALPMSSVDNPAPLQIVDILANPFPSSDKHGADHLTSPLVPSSASPSSAAAPMPVSGSLHLPLGPGQVSSPGDSIKSGGPSSAASNA